MTHVGFHYTIQWASPYSDPPGGLPKIMAEMYETLDQREHRREIGEYGNGVPPSFSALHKIGDGYCVCITSVSTPSKPYSQKTLASVRLKRITRRLSKKYPLIADELIADEIKKKPEYFSGITDEKIKANYDKAIEWEKEVYDRFLEGVKKGQVFVYGVPQEIL